jgi:NADH dehydrogenase FAD-containing subunit
MPSKIILIGASTANLYAGKKLKELNYNPIIFERKNNLKNEQNRLLPNKFLKKLGYVDSDDGKDQYVKLTDLKHYLAKDLNIRFNTDVLIDYGKEEIIANNKQIDFDYAIVITGHKEVISKDKKIFTYNYSLDNPKNHYAGNSLMTACEKVKGIIENIS